MTWRILVRACLGLVGAIVILGGVVASQPVAAADARKSAEAAIRKADEDWVKAAQSKQPAAWVAFYADDAVVLPPNDKVAADRGAITKTISDLLGLPELTIDWRPVKVEAARSGDLVYVYGTYELSFKDSSGKTISDRGKYAEVWRRQAKVGWKCVLDTWNSDQPAT